MKQNSTEQGAAVKRLQRYGRRGAIFLLAVMLAFTLISRITYSFTVAKVMVDNPAARKIEHTVTAEGTVEKNRELAVMTEPNILVKTVYAVVGQKIQAGELLAELDLTDLHEQMTQLENQIQILQLQNQSESSNAKLSAESKQTQINRAQEDYNRTVQENDALVAAAGAALQAAQDALMGFDNAANQADTGGQDETQDETQDGNQNETQDGTQDGNQAETQRESLTAAISTAQAAYDEAVKNRAAEVLAAQRKIEDANAAQSTNNMISINDITIKELEKQLEKLNVLQQQEGKINAEDAGVITNAYLIVGQKTGSTAAFTIADLDSGMRFVAQINKDDAKYVAAGDEVKLSTINVNVSNLTIDTVEASEDGQMLIVTVMLSADELSIGDTATLQTVKTSDRFDITVPLTALYEDNGKYYVYVMAEVDTVLGGQYEAQRRDVEVEDKNNKYAALKNSSLTANDQIIVDCDRYISAGDKVRLWEQ